MAKNCPNDKDAKNKFIECGKMVRKLAFERAIASDEVEKNLSDMFSELESIGKFVESYHDYIVYESSVFRYLIFLFYFILYYLAIESDYAGPKLEDGKVTLEFMKELMEHYKDQKKLHRKFAYKVCPRLSYGFKIEIDLYLTNLNFFIDSV